MKSRKVIIGIIGGMIVATILASAVIVFIPTELPTVLEPVYEIAPTEDTTHNYYEVNGISDSRFYIKSPKTECLNIVDVAMFGVSPESPNNTEALNSAFNYCKDNPGTRLVFGKGIYYVGGDVCMSDLADTYIDGNGAELLYQFSGTLLSIKNCNSLVVANLTVDWDWDTQPLGAIASAIAVEGQPNALDFVFDLPELAREDMFYAISECDQETGTYGSYGTFIESYDGQNPDVFKQITKISHNTVRVIHNGSLSYFAGKRFILRGTAYGGSVINMGGESKDVTFENINLYGGSGMGIVVGEKSSHFAIRNVFIGPNPAFMDTRCISLDCDAVHINDATGCFIIEDCDFSKQGDDDVNINTGIAMIDEVREDGIVFDVDNSIIAEPGTRVVFRDKNFNPIGFETVVETCVPLESGLNKVTFADDIPISISKGCMFHPAESLGGNYVIRNNYFHEHRARGLLLQTSNGLVENNKFYKTTHDAIRIVMDINGVWHEGNGADNIEIRGNTFDTCALIGTELIEIGTHLMQKSAGSHAFTNITFKDNTFTNICGYLMAVNNVNNLVFINNTITVGALFPSDMGRGRSYFLKDCVNVDFRDNSYTDTSAWSLTQIPRCENPFTLVRISTGICQRRK